MNYFKLYLQKSFVEPDLKSPETRSQNTFWETTKEFSSRLKSQANVIKPSNQIWTWNLNSCLAIDADFTLCLD